MSLPPNLNPTGTCACGNTKLPSHQWCPHCWNALPAKSAIRFARKSHTLRAQIINSQRLINHALAPTSPT